MPIDCNGLRYDSLKSYIPSIADGSRVVSPFLPHWTIQGMGLVELKSYQMPLFIGFDRILPQSVTLGTIPSVSLLYVAKKTTGLSDFHVLHKYIRKRHPCYPIELSPHPQESYDRDSSTFVLGKRTTGHSKAVG